MYSLRQIDFIVFLMPWITYRIRQVNVLISRNEWYLNVLIYFIINIKQTK